MLMPVPARTRPAEVRQKPLRAVGQKEDHIYMLKGPRPPPKRRRSTLLASSSAIAGLLAATVLLTTPTGSRSGPRGTSSSRRQFCRKLRYQTRHIVPGILRTGFPDAVDLAYLFMKQYPNVTWKHTPTRLCRHNSRRPTCFRPGRTLRT